jgi:hypothetical protein
LARDGAERESRHAEERGAGLRRREGENEGEGVAEGEKCGRGGAEGERRRGIARKKRYSR